MDQLRPSLLVRRRYLVLIVYGSLLLVPFLGAFDFWYPDEPDLAQVCQDMDRTGDWISPRRNGVIWIDYPPLMYWAGCVSARVFGGVGEFTLRLPIALAAIAIALVTCQAASKWFGARTGLWAGVILLTCLQLTHNAVGYRPDLLFTLGIGAGLLVYAQGSAEEAKWWPRIFAFAIFGVAMLAKGPLGLLLPGLVLTLWHAGRKEWTRLLVLAPLSLISLAIFLPWAVAVAAAMGKDNVAHELYAQNVGRFFSGSRGHDKPWFYYFVGIWVDILPWSPLLPFAFLWVRAQRLWKDRYVQLLLWWFGASFVFLTIATTKRQLYLIPAYPALAILMGWWIASLRNAQGDSPPAPNPWPARVLSYAGSAVAFGMGTAAFLWGLGGHLVLERLTKGNRLRFETIAGMQVNIFCFGVIVLLIAFWLRKRRTLDPSARLAGVAVAVWLGYIAISGLILPSFNPLKTYTPQGRWLRAQIGDSQRVGMYAPDTAFGKKGGIGYTIEGLVAVLESEAAAVAFFEQYPDSLLLIRPPYAEPFLKSKTIDWRACMIREFGAADLYFKTGEDGLPLFLIGRYPYYVCTAPP